jgi:acetate CoA/acetoacetate CoA-transferase beta subunit
MKGRELIAMRVAQEFHDGDYVNLGIGLPTMVANYIPENIHVTMHAENGILGVGPTPEKGYENEDCADAGGNYVTAVPGAAFFDSPTSFAIIRGGHLDITVLGALEVDQEGNLASWMVPGKMVTGMGGAMDLVVGARKVIVATDHINKKGEPKILKNCKLPLTAQKEVDLIVTDMAVIEMIQGIGLLLKEIAPGLSVDDVKAATDADLTVAEDLKVMMS